MRNPSIDFNAIAPNFLNKTSASADVKQGADRQKKNKGGILWNMAAGLRKIVTNRLKSGGGQQQSTPLEDKHGSSSTSESQGQV